MANATGVADSQAVLTAYELRHLTAHLEEADRVDDLHRLLALTTRDGRNAWYQAKDSAKEFAGYAADVDRAWRLAERETLWSGGDRASGSSAADAASFADRRAHSVALQCRYAIIDASVTSLSRNIPSSLFATFVGAGIWSSAHALAVARQVPDPKHRVAGLVGLASHLTPGMLEDALTAVGEIQDDNDRIDGVLGLAPHLSPDRSARALHVATSVTKPSIIARALAGLAPYLTDTNVQEALDMTLRIPSAVDRAIALARLAPRLSDAQLRTVLEETHKVKSVESKALMLASLVGHLTGDAHRESLAEALQLALRIRKDDVRAHVLADLIPHLEPVEQREPIVREVLKSVRTRKHAQRHFQVLASLGPYLSPTLLSEVVSILEEINSQTVRVQAFVALAARVSLSDARTALVDEALAIVKTVKGDRNRANALAAIVPLLDQTQTETAFVLLRGIRTGEYKADALTILAPLLDESRLESTLARALTMKDWRGRAALLASLYPHLPAERRADVLHEALTAANTIEHATDRIAALGRLAPNLPPTERAAVLQTALDASRKIDIGDDYLRAEAVFMFALQMSEPQRSLTLRRALRAAQNITVDFYRSGTLRALAPLAVALDDGETVLQAVHSIQEERDRTSVLASLVPHLPEAKRRDATQEVLQSKAHDDFYSFDPRVDVLPYVPEAEASKIAGDLLYGYSWGGFLAVLRMENLISYLSEQQVRTLLANPTDDGDRTKSALLPRLAELGYQEEAWDQARQVPDSGMRADAMVSLARCFADSRRDEALDQSLDAIRRIDNAGLRAHLTARLIATVASSSNSNKLLSLALTIEDAESRVSPLTMLLPYLNESDRDRVVRNAIDAAQEIRSAEARAAALCDLLSEVDEDTRSALVREAVESARTIRGDEPRAALLTRLVPHVPEMERSEMLSEALDAARRMSNAQLSTMYFSQLSPQTSESDRIAASTSRRGGRAKILATLVPLLVPLPYASLYAIFREILHTLSADGRQSLLVDLASLAPIIAALGGQAALAETADAIEHAGSWWA